VIAIPVVVLRNDFENLVAVVVAIAVVVFLVGRGVDAVVVFVAVARVAVVVEAGVVESVVVVVA